MDLSLSTVTLEEFYHTLTQPSPFEGEGILGRTEAARLGPTLRGYWMAKVTETWEVICTSGDWPRA